jgi:hypothetical protein
VVQIRKEGLVRWEVLDLGETEMIIMAFWALLGGVSNWGLEVIRAEYMGKGLVCETSVCCHAITFPKLVSFGMHEESTYFHVTNIQSTILHNTLS